METRANYVLIGGFVLAVAALAIAVSVWLVLGRDGEGLRRVDVIFPGVVTGLSEGSAVRLNGIRIGTVNALSFDLDDPDIVIASLDVDKRAPLRRDVIVNLGFQGLTGIAHVQMIGGSTSADSIFSDIGDDEVPRLYADRSSIQALLEGSQNIVAQASGVLSLVRTVLEENRAPVRALLANAETISGALAQSPGSFGDTAKNLEQFSKNLLAFSDRMLTIADKADVLADMVSGEDYAQIVNDAGFALRQFGALSENAAQLATRIDGVVGKADAIIGAVEAEEYAQIVNDVGRAARKIGDAGERAARLVAGIDTALADLSVFSGRLADSFTQVESILEQLSGDAMTGLISDASQSFAVFAENRTGIETAIAEITRLSENFADVSQTLAARRGVLEQFMTDIGAAGTRLAALSSQLQGLGDQIDPDALGRTITAFEELGTSLNVHSGTAGEILGDTGAAARSVRIMADALSSRARTATDALDQALAASTSANRLARQMELEGPNIAAIISDARRTAEQFDQLSAQSLKVVEELDTILASSDAGGLSDLRDALRNFNGLAVELRNDLGPLVDTLDTATDRSADEFAASMVEFQKTLRNARNFLLILSQNPDRLIFGGPPRPVFER